MRTVGNQLLPASQNAAMDLAFPSFHPLASPLTRPLMLRLPSNQVRGLENIFVESRQRGVCAGGVRGVIGGHTRWNWYVCVCIPVCGGWGGCWTAGHIANAKHAFVRNQRRLGNFFLFRYRVNVHLRPMSNQTDRPIDFGRGSAAVLFPFQVPFGSIWAHLGSIWAPLGFTWAPHRPYLNPYEHRWPSPGPT